MNKLGMEKLILGPVQTNTYIVYNKTTKECVVIDPTGKAQKIEDKIKTLDVTPVAVMLTHGHFDHIGAVDEISALYDIPVYVTTKDSAMLGDPMLNASAGLVGRSISCKYDKTYEDGDILHILDVDWKIIETPGHTAGSCCLYIESEKVLMSGDTLFAGSYGRCDLPSGSEADIYRSLNEKIFTLPDDVVVYPGHMEETDIGYEKKYNPAKENI